MIKSAYRVAAAVGVAAMAFGSTTAMALPSNFYTYCESSTCYMVSCSNIDGRSFCSIIGQWPRGREVSED
jgi:hypothetical protein